MQPLIPLHDSNSLQCWYLRIFPFGHAAVWWKDFNMILSRSSHCLQLLNTRITCAKKQRILNLLFLCLQWDDSLARYHLELNDQLCYWVYSCSREGTWDPAVATSCYARRFSCNSCLKEWSKGVIYKKGFLWIFPCLSAIEVEVPEEKE